MKLAANNISTSTFLRILLWLYMRRNWWWMALPVAACAVTALVLADDRFLLVALMIAFIVVPMLMPLLYFNYALRPQCRWSILEKTITTSADGLHLDFSDERMNPHVLPWSHFASRRVSHHCLLLMFKGSRYSFFAIPLSAFESTDDLRELLKHLTDNKEKQK